VLQEGHQLDLGAVRGHWRAHGVAMQSCPEQIVVTGALPRNSMGKVLKQELRLTLVADAQ
jgi:non-ribosomal peptide synthetase component E (peptide arylation enzyme)